MSEFAEAPSGQRSRGAIVVGNGDPPTAGMLTSLVEAAACWGARPLLIAADGAAQALRELGTQPDMVVGDFDSLSPETRQALLKPEYLHIPDQETSDLEKAVQVAMHRGAGRILLVGARGDRVDHSLTAISLMLAYHARIRIQMVDSRYICEVVQKNLAWRGSAGDIVSLITFQEAVGVTLEGVRWPLHNDTLLPGTRGVSNVMTGEVGRLKVARGILLLCREHRGDLRERL